MRLDELVQYIPGVIATAGFEGNPPVSGPVVEDSRAVQPGGIFVARPGLTVDGHRFIPAAASAGAALIVGALPPDQVNAAVPYVQVHDPALALAHLAAALAGFPARRLVMIGVTGTDGKTTTSTLIYHILKAAGLASGMISTVSAVLGDREVPTGLHVTTPTAPEVQGYLADMLAAGLTHCVLEATSHGLAQHRVAACDFDVAVVTNIQHEHLDFHGSWESYRDAKALLFRALSAGVPKPGVPKLAVINLDDANSAHYLLGIPADRHLRYALDPAAGVDVHVSALEFGTVSTRFNLHLPGRDPLAVVSPLVGRFNVSNILAAAAAASGLGIDSQSIRSGIEAVRGVPGRMERIDEGQDFLAVVDFAHTPNALHRALEAARLMIAPGARVIVVFGSAGLRDPEKRRMMGDIAARLADLTVITAEDPRTEDLDTIIAASAEAAAAAGGIEGKTFWRVPDRGEAIHYATTLARPGDIVLACGKGHEQSMCFGTVEYPWDDREAMRAALRGVPLRTLPTASQP